MNIDENGEIFEDDNTPAAHSTTVVVSPVAQRNPTTGNPLKDALNAADFNYKDGVQLVANNGNIVLRTSKTTKGGEWLDIDVVSWKKMWVCSPGANGAPKDTVAYSSDGVNCNNPEQGLLSTHLQSLKESGYSRAKIEERAIVFGYYVGSEKPLVTATGTPDEVQIDLAPTAAKAWGSFINRLDAALSRRRIAVETASIVRFSAVVQETKNGDSYTSVEMSSPQKGNQALMIGR
jgi:hypothetical protein